MKKFLVVVLILIMALCLVACGGSDDATSDTSDAALTSSGDNSDTAVDSDDGISLGKKEMSITPAAGWERMEAAVVPQYENVDGRAPGGMVILTVDPQMDDDHVAYAQDLLKNTFPSATFSDTANTTVDGMDALQYTMTYDVSGLVLMQKYTYIIQDSYVYSIACSALEKDFGAVSDDFDTMINSLVLK